MTRPGSGLRRAWLWIAWFAVSWALWIVLAQSVSPPELIAGAGVAAAAATVALALRHDARLVRPGFGELRSLSRAVLAIPRDLGRLVRVLVDELAGRESAGAFAEVPFDPGPEGDATREVFGAAIRSLSPNEYAVDVDREAGRMLVHRLTPDRRAP